MRDARAFISKWPLSRLSQGPGLLLFLGVGIVVLMLVSIQWQSSRNHVELLGGKALSEAELESARAAFDSKGLKGYRIVNQKLQVPRKESSRYLAALVERRVLPYQYFENALKQRSWLTPEGDFKRQWDLAAQQMIADIIREMDGIKEAWVRWDKAQEGGLHRQEDVRASVIVKTEQHQTLTANMVHLIRELVSGQLSGLAAEKVTVVDLGMSSLPQNAHRYFTLFFRARYVTALLSLLGMVILYLWTKELFGKTSALVAAFFWSCSPNIIAYAGVLTTDLGITTFGLAATYVYWRWLAAPSYHRAAVSGVLLGLVQLVKFSALIFYPLWIVIAIGHYLQTHNTVFTGLLFARKTTPCKSISQTTPRRSKRNSYILQFITIILLSVLVINLGYGFEGFGQRLGDFPFLSSTLTRPRESGQSAYPNHPNPLLRRLYHARQNRFEHSWIGTLPLPLPRHYVLGFDEQSFETNPQLEKTLPDFSVGTGYPVYLRGELRTTKNPETDRVGWWYYYLYALAVKVPVSTWIALGFAALSFLYYRNTNWRFADFATLSGPPLLLLGTLSFLTDINIGLRYVLPVLPFLWIFIARLVATSSPLMAKTSILRRWSVTLLFLAFSWNTYVTIITFPHYLSFFNYLAGGSHQGHKHLIDSNLDWGQDLLELHSWLKQHPQPSAIGLAYFGLVDPSILDIDFFLPPQNTTGHLHKQRISPSLPPGLYAISINYRQGLPYKSYNEHGKLVPVPYNAYRYFQQFQPIDRIGNSIWLFRIGPDRHGTLERN